MEIKFTFDVPKNNLIVCVLLNRVFVFNEFNRIKIVGFGKLCNLGDNLSICDVNFFFFCVFCFPMHLHSMSIFIVIKSMTNPFVFLNYKINAKLHCVCHFRCKCKIAFVRTIPSDFIIPEILER